MMAKVASKQKRIDVIVEMLAKGLERKEILVKIGKRWNISRTTIDNEIKAAKIILADRNKEAEEIRLRVSGQMTEDAVKDGLKSDLELELILCQFASGNAQVEEWIKGEVVLRGISPMESIVAIDKIYKKRGSYAPSKFAPTDKDGNDVAPQILTDNQFSQLITAINGQSKV